MPVLRQTRADDLHAASPKTRESFDGWGYEYRSQATILGFPLLHVSFKYGPNKVPVPARGVIAIGQFAIGFVAISQFGVGVFSLSQITVAGYAIAQIAVAYALVAQIGIYFGSGYGQIVRRFSDLLGG